MAMELDADIELVGTPPPAEACPDPMDMIDGLPVLPVLLSSLRPGFFMRQLGMDATHVQLLVDAASSSQLAAILIQKHSLRVIDGMHRIEAARLRGEESVNARLVDCSDEEAFILAVKSNTLHGLPLSRADRIAGAKQILEWHWDWSDRAVAAASGLGAKTIAGLRHRSGVEVPDISKRLGRDGKRRPITGIDGRKRAAEYLAMRPDAPLREVAREADVSLGTVHDVRSKLRRGIDPTTVGKRAAPPEQEASGSAKEADYARPSPANGPCLRQVRRIRPAASWGTISPKLASDPSVRYTEGGRAFLRWMSMRVMQPGEWKDIVDAVPAHWSPDVSLIAESIGDAWHEFAGHLRAREDPAV